MRRDPERVPDSTWRLLRVLNTPAVVLGRHLDVLDVIDEPSAAALANLAVMRDEDLPGQSAKPQNQ